jgi:pyruvate kinase
MRKTKIVCTIGPASCTEDVFMDMALAGMSVARLNFSHGTHEGHQKTIDMIKRVRERLGLPIAILLDTKGPEYRIRTFKDGKITVKDGDTFVFTTEDVVGDETRVSVNYPHLCENLTIGDKILVNNGLVVFEVRDLSETEATCTVIAGRDAGQIVGASKTNYVTDCVATNVTVTAGGDCTGANIRNEIIGRVL